MEGEKLPEIKKASRTNDNIKLYKKLILYFNVLYLFCNKKKNIK
jgi:hypothetical protein